jgi:hypothetical protein
MAIEIVDFPIEHGGFMVAKWDLMGFNGIYPLVNIQKTMDNHNF